MVTNRATGKFMLLYIGDSFVQPWSGGAIDIFIGVFIELYGSDPNANHELVLNPVDRELTGHVDPAYTAYGADSQTDSSGNTANTIEAGNIDPSDSYGPATLTTTTRGKIPSSTSTSQDLDCDWAVTVGTVVLVSHVRISIPVEGAVVNPEWNMAAA